MKIIIAITVLLLATAFMFKHDVTIFFSKQEQEYSQDKKQKGKKNKKNTAPSGEIIILEKWDLPDELKEVSGITYMDNDRFACIQDEQGTVYIFNRASKKIEKRIKFAGKGDFEGIALKANNVYVVRSDGTLYETDMNTEKTTEYKTHLTVVQNVEGLCYDLKRDRLLLAIKDNEPGNPGYKGIYAFDISKKTLLKEPAYKINLQNEILKDNNGKKSKSIMPSSIAVNPLNDDIYITDGPGSKLFVMSQEANIKKLYNLGTDFSQPEGITFDKAGGLYISNEGKKISGNIIKIEIRGIEK